MRLERLTRERTPSALAFLDRSPYDNVLLSYLVAFEGSNLFRNVTHIAVDEAGEPRGVAYFGRQMVLCADTAAIDPFARHALRCGGERSISGPRPDMLRFWPLIAQHRRRPRLIRDRQLTMMVDRHRLRRGPAFEIRLARPDEWPEVAANSAEMIRSELAYEPRSSPEFAANVRTAIGQKRWWIGRSEARTCFFCSIGPWSRATAQLQSVWTPPALRGRGLATAALSAICDRLLATFPTLSLQVNDFNADAIALYERVGFEHVSDYQTILF